MNNLFKILLTLFLTILFIPLSAFADDNDGNRLTPQQVDYINKTIKDVRLPSYPSKQKVETIIYIEQDFVTNSMPEITLAFVRLNEDKNYPGEWGPKSEIKYDYIEKYILKSGSNEWTKTYESDETGILYLSGVVFSYTGKPWKSKYTKFQTESSNIDYTNDKKESDKGMLDHIISFFKNFQNAILKILVPDIDKIKSSFDNMLERVKQKFNFNPPDIKEVMKDVHEIKLLEEDIRFGNAIFRAPVIDFTYVNNAVEKFRPIIRAIIIFNLLLYWVNQTMLFFNIAPLSKDGWERINHTPDSFRSIGIINDAQWHNDYRAFEQEKQKDALAQERQKAYEERQETFWQEKEKAINDNYDLQMKLADMPYMKNKNEAFKERARIIKDHKLGLIKK